MRFKGFKINPIKVIVGGIILVAATLAGKAATDVVGEGIVHKPEEKKDEAKTEETPEVSEEATEEKETLTPDEIIDKEEK